MSSDVPPGATGPPGGSPVPLESVITTAELERRPSRPPDYEADSRALAALMDAMASATGRPGADSVLQKLAETALALCRAHSAGVSILEKEGGREVFRWRAAAGAWARFLGGCMPRDRSPCGTVLERNGPILMSYPERHYLYSGDAPPLAEVLLIPFHCEGKPVGTLWVIAHDPARQFDAEDYRLMSNLARFAATAYQLLAAQELRTALAVQRARDEQLERANAELLKLVGTGELLGQYQMLEKVGQGGMGTVCKALHTLLRRVVALKVLPADRARSAEVVARFLREMQAAGRLHHPNIVQALDAREVNGVHFLVMEFVEGVNLAKVSKRLGPLPVPDCAEMIRQAALGLQHAHEHGLSHREVKPSNLMLTPDGHVKVLDLGLAWLAGEPADPGCVAGTPDYMAPEQLSGSPPDIRADIYCLGCTLYHLLLGHAPFSGPQFGTAVDKVLAHARRPVPPVRGLRAEAPDGLACVLDRLLAKEPAHRFSTPARVAAALGPFAAGADLPRLFLQAEALKGGPAGEPESSFGGLPTTIAE
jgi:hypothetical protein